MIDRKKEGEREGVQDKMVYGEEWPCELIKYSVIMKKSS